MRTHQASTPRFRLSIGGQKFEGFLHLNYRFLDSAQNDKRSVKYFLQTAFFPLYSRFTASGACESLLCDLGGFFVAQARRFWRSFVFEI
jgi:hypothetical protein